MIIHESYHLPKVKYLYITEHDPEAEIRWHHHIIMDGLLDMDIAESLWNKGDRNQARRLQKDKYGLAGMANYITKNKNRGKFEKRWNCSTSVNIPFDTLFDGNRTEGTVAITNKVPTFTAATTTNSTVNTFYQVQINGDYWLPVVENDEDFAGIIGAQITGVAVSVDKGYLEYQVHTSTGWHGIINSNNTNINDYINGYAGNGEPIDGVRIYYYTPEDIANSQAIRKLAIIRLHCIRIITVCNMMITQITDRTNTPVRLAYIWIDFKF
jgi:hypothetical protein